MSRTVGFQESPAGFGGHLEVRTVVSAGGAEPVTISRPGTCSCFNNRAGLAWSPDGGQMALVGPALHGYSPLFVMNADGSGRHRLLWDATNRPAWRPVP